MRHRQIFCQLLKRNSARGRFPCLHQVLRNRMLSTPVKWNRNRSPLRPDYPVAVTQKSFQNRIVLKPPLPLNSVSAFPHQPESKKMRIFCFPI